MEISSSHHIFQTVRARDLKFLHNVHHHICVMCHVSCVMCHVSCVTCHVSPVTCHLSHVTCHLSHVKRKKNLFFFLLKKSFKKSIKVSFVTSGSRGFSVFALYIYFNLQKKLDKVVELVGGGSVINGAYPI